MTARVCVCVFSWFVSVFWAQEGRTIKQTGFLNFVRVGVAARRLYRFSLTYLHVSCLGLPAGHFHTRVGVSFLGYIIAYGGVL